MVFLVASDWPLELRNRMIGMGVPLLLSWRTRAAEYLSPIGRSSTALGSWGRINFVHVIKASLSSTGSRAEILTGTAGNDCWLNFFRSILRMDTSGLRFGRSSSFT